MPAKSYYAGGARVVVEGVPIRMARKPRAADLAHLREWEKERAREYTGFTKEAREEYAQRRARDANDAIAAYAEALEISVNQAKARIARQRQHLIDNPTRDISLEYDL